MGLQLLWVKAPTDIDGLGRCHVHFKADLFTLLVVKLSFLYLRLQIINLELGCFSSVARPDLSLFSLVRDTMERLLLLLVVISVR